MSQRHKVTTILKDRDWDAFHALLLDRRTQIDDAHAWMRKHGYSISRTAVGSYARRFRMGMLFNAGVIGLGSDHQMRRKLATLAARLKGQELYGVLLFAAFVANNVSAAKGFTGMREVAMPAKRRAA